MSFDLSEHKQNSSVFSITDNGNEGSQDLLYSRPSAHFTSALAPAMVAQPFLSAAVSPCPNNLSAPQTGCSLNPVMGNVTLQDKTPG